jgi:hypothetical protein
MLAEEQQIEVAEDPMRPATRTQAFFPACLTTSVEGEFLASSNTHDFTRVCSIQECKHLAERDPSIREAKEGGWNVPGQPGLYSWAI